MEIDVTTTSTTRTSFAYDGLNPWADLNGCNALVMGPGDLYALAQHAIRIHASGNAPWYEAGRQRSVRDVIDHGAAILLDPVDYDVHDKITGRTAPAGGDDYKYRGRGRGTETGLQYNRTRYHDPKVGRWTTEDPIGFQAGDGNLYRYVQNGPQSRNDPEGTLGWDVKDPPKHKADRLGGWNWVAILKPTGQASKDSGRAIDSFDERRGFIIQEFFAFAAVYDSNNQLIAHTGEFPDLFDNAPGGTPVISHFYELFYSEGHYAYTSRGGPFSAGNPPVPMDKALLSNDTFDFSGGPKDSHGTAFYLGILYWDEGKTLFDTATNKREFSPSDGWDFWRKPKQQPNVDWSVLTSKTRPTGIKPTRLRRFITSWWNGTFQKPYQHYRSFHT